MRRRLLTLALHIALGPSLWSATAAADCGNPVPPWLSEDDSRVFFVGEGSGSTAEEATAAARADIERQIARCGESLFSSRGETTRVIHVVEQSGRSERVTIASVERTAARSLATATGYREVTSYACEAEAGAAVKLVASLPVEGVPGRCGGQLPGSMGVVWRSAVAPGWGQLRKGDAATGYAIVVIEAVTIPTAIVAGVASRDQRDRAADAHRKDGRDMYNERADILYYVGAGAAAIAIGTYVFNLLNAYGEPTHYGVRGADNATRVSFVPFGVAGRF
ncbi:MAG: hypothetical protein ACOC1F_11310 [Myxococcota bacterium]